MKSRLVMVAFSADIPAPVLRQGRDMYQARNPSQAAEALRASELPAITISRQ